MMTQIFEYIVTNIASVRKDILIEEEGEKTSLSTVLEILKAMGHAEY